MLFTTSLKTRMFGLTCCVVGKIIIHLLLSAIDKSDYNNIMINNIHFDQVENEDEENKKGDKKNKSEPNIPKRRDRGEELTPILGIKDIPSVEIATIYLSN